VIEVTHITNLTGQIMPVKELVEFARPRGIEVFVDGAHAYAHFPFKRDDLDCDYYGTSLHKWLLVPIGAGFLYVRKDKQKKLWPLMAAAQEQDDNIRKYEEIGPIPPPTTTPFPRRWRSIGPSGPTARSPACGGCGTAGPSASWRKATG
jgi:kynureninase